MRKHFVEIYRSSQKRQKKQKKTTGDCIRAKIENPHINDGERERERLLRNIFVDNMNRLFSCSPPFLLIIH